MKIKHGHTQSERYETARKASGKPPLSEQRKLAWEVWIYYPALLQHSRVHCRFTPTMTSNYVGHLLRVILDKLSKSPYLIIIYQALY